MKKGIARLRLGGILPAVLLHVAAGAALAAGYEFEGIGARQVSRGGAAVADSADWTALYWNPANVRKAVEAEPWNAGLKVFGGEARAKDSDSLSRLLGPIFTKDRLSSGFLLGAAGAAIRAGRFGVAAGFYTPLLQGVDFADESPAGVGLRYDASAGIVTGSLVAALEIAPRFYAGAGVNLLHGRVETDSRITNLPPGETVRHRLKGDGTGLEGVVGLRYEPAPRWAVGAVYRTGADIAVKGDASAHRSMFPEESSRFRYDLRHPPTAGLGVAVRPTERYSLHADLTRTYWRRFSDALRYDENGVLLLDRDNTFNWRTSRKFRFGAGFHLTDRTELLGGYSHDRPALDAGSVDFSTTIDVPMNRLYFGVAHRWTETWETIAGGVYGRGRRSAEGVDYRLSGWQLMLETQVRAGGVR